MRLLVLGGTGFAGPPRVADLGACGSVRVMSQHTQRPDTVLLDVDGTLIDSNYWHVTAWQQAFAEAGAWQPAWRLHSCIGMGGDRLVAAVAGDDLEERLGDTVRASWKRIYDRMLPNVHAFRHASELIAELKRRGFRVVLASSGNPDHLDYAQRLLGQQDLIDAVTTGEDVESTKPSGELFKQALSKAGGERGVVIGDTPWDGEAAADLDAPVIGVRCGGFSAQALTGSGASVVFDDPSDLLAHLGQTLLA